MDSLVWIILDSCRYDSFACADTPWVRQFAARNQTSVERRFSYASWTAPSHYAFLMGLVPHRGTPGVLAGQVFKNEFMEWSRRLDIRGLDFAKFVPHLSLPKLLNELGYHTVARVSLPVLNECTLLSAHFHDYRLMEHHADFPGMIEAIRPLRGPAFYFLNLGETHYPYMLDDPALPRLSGVHGAARSMLTDPSPGPPRDAFDAATLDRLRRQQVKCVEYVDSLLPRLFEDCPRRTHVIITADHGELFGEANCFGHGPVVHEKVFEVPFIEGKLP